MKVEVGSKWISSHAYGRKDAISYKVHDVTEHGIYVTSPECRHPGHLFSHEEFSKLYRSDTR